MRPRQLSPGAPAVPGRYQPWPQRLQGGARAQSSSGAPMFTLSLSVPLAGATPKQPPGSRVGPGRRARAGRGISCSPGLSSRSAQAGAEGPPVPVVTSRHQPAPADPPISPPRPPPTKALPLHSPGLCLGADTPAGPPYPLVITSTHDSQGLGEPPSGILATWPSLPKSQGV